MPRTIVKTHAIVLRTMRLGETSSLVTLYAQECGKLKAMARGARKPKSRFGAALGLMTEVQAVCYIKETRDLQTLSECTLLKPAPDLSQSLERLSLWQRRLRVGRSPDDRRRGQPPALPVPIWGIARPC